MSFSAFFADRVVCFKVPEVSGLTTKLTWIFNVPRRFFSYHFDRDHWFSFCAINCIFFCLSLFARFADTPSVSFRFSHAPTLGNNGGAFFTKNSEVGMGHVSNPRSFSINSSATLLAASAMSKAR